MAVNLFVLLKVAAILAVLDVKDGNILYAKRSAIAT